MPSPGEYEIAAELAAEAFPRVGALACEIASEAVPRGSKLLAEALGICEKTSGAGADLDLLTAVGDPQAISAAASKSWLWSDTERTLATRLPIASGSLNPYADRFELVSKLGKTGEFKSALIGHYAHAIPTEEALMVAVDQGPIVEIGAGNGYWAHLTRTRGADVAAYDAWCGSAYSRGTTWTQVLTGGEAAIAKHPEHALMLSWPSSNGVAERSLDLFLRNQGQRFIYVGELGSDIMGDDQFFARLGSDFNLTRTVKIPTWPGNYDALHLFTRR